MTAIGDHRCRGVAGADNQRRIEDVRQKLLEIAAAVGGDVGADILALAVELVTLGTDLVEVQPARFRIAGRLLEQVAHLGDELLALRIAAIADRAPDFGHLLDELGVLAGEQLADLVDVEDVGRQSLGGDFGKEGSAPNGSLRKQIDCFGLQVRLHGHVILEHGCRYFRILEFAEFEQNLTAEL